jgi:hypothetical protein
MNSDQKLSFAIFTKTYNASFILKSQAILNSNIAANKINQALFGLVAPPIVLVV